MKFLVLWRIELSLLSKEMVGAVARMSGYGEELQSAGSVLHRYHVIGAHGGAWIYDVASHEEFEMLLARAPVFNFARYEVLPLAEMTARAEGRDATMSSVYQQPWIGRHLLVTQRLRHRRDELGLTQKQVVSRLGRLGVVTTNRALSSLEHGAGLDVAKLPEMAHVLECTLTYLVGLTDDPHSWSPDPEVAMLHPDETPHTHPNRAPHAHPHQGAHSHQDIVDPRGSRSSCILGSDVPERVRRFG